MVRLTTLSNTQVTLPLTEYKKIISTFADTVKDFYEKSSPKIKSAIENFTDETSYQRFWEDWDMWRDCTLERNKQGLSEVPINHYNSGGVKG
jgi:hypothetical protein